MYFLNHLVMDQQGWSRFESSIDLMGSDPPVLPSAGGVYVLMSEKTLFTYPAGATSVFYIGQASNLQARLASHRKFSQDVRDGKAPNRYYPRYEWAANHGALVADAVRPRVNSVISPKAMESHLLCVFAEGFRAQPLANCAERLVAVEGASERR